MILIFLCTVSYCIFIKQKSEFTKEKVMNE
jgi:hypothetical protein